MTPTASREGESPAPSPRWRPAHVGRAASLRRRAIGASPSALLVPVPVAAPLVPPRADDLPPHVTVLYPFLPARQIDHRLPSAVAEALARIGPFDFELAEVGRFPPNVLYLAPEPAEPFVAMTQACVRRWPDHPPYGGMFAKVIPHLTLVEGPEPPGLADRAATALPLRARAEEVWLMSRSPRGRWRHRATIPLPGAPPEAR